jgi:chromosome segregation ATPase
MSALQKLQEKIEQWRVDHEALKSENAQLKVELSNVSGSQNEQESQIAALKRELEEKDVEIEKIIAQVETLLA